jgi:hypothetical protein|tara:strand:+ start:933 stop:1172 length:240 start_codon:yes stop_codon:yes gene_type:complete
MNNTDYNNDRTFHPIKSDMNYENIKWDSCNLRQENAKYGFQVMSNGFVVAGGRALIVSGGGGRFEENKLNNPLNLINKK